MLKFKNMKFNKVAYCYPHVSIAYWIFLSMQATMASTEIRFSKLDYWKTTWSSLSEEMLRDSDDMSSYVILSMFFSHFQ